MRSGGCARYGPNAWTGSWSGTATSKGVLTEYVKHYNTARPHRGIDLDVPMPAPMATVTTLPAAGHVERIGVLGGLVHEYRHAA
jgi:hypothetical protein